MRRDSKTLGACFTPEAVAAALVRWAVRNPADLLLDPSSGDGRFVALVLACMSGKSPTLAANRGRCACANALLAVDPGSGPGDGGVTC